MNISPGPYSNGRCTDSEFRLTVYEAGHALCARALQLKIISVRMLPRPPVLVSEKTFSGNKIGPLVLMLENRVIELFGGQIAETEVCSTSSCCSGDISRIDELTRLIAGLTGKGDAESVWFELEDVAESIFKDERYRNAIVPIAEFLQQRVSDGWDIIAGDDIEVELDKYVPSIPKGSGFKKFMRHCQAALSN